MEDIPEGIVITIGGRIMKTYTLPLGRMNEAEHEHPERTARKQGSGMFPDYIFQVWPDRAAMARSIRMQERRSPTQYDWKAIIKLSDGEGF